jgi:hypothetical protein
LLLLFGLVQDYLALSLIDLPYMLKFNLIRLDVKTVKVRTYS